MRRTLALLLVLLPAGSGYGFVCLQFNGACLHWANDHATINSALAVGGVPVYGGTLLNGTLSFDENAVDAGTRWNAVGTPFQFSVQVVQQVNDPCGPAGPNHACPNTGPAGDNPILFAADFCGQGFGDIIAATNNCADISTGAMVNAPVIFGTTVAWNAYDGPLLLPSGPYDIHRVLLHELGHVLGLAHPDDYGQNVAAIMNRRVSDLYLLQGDDMAGIRSSYPGTAPNSGPTTNSCQLDPTARPARAWVLLVGGVMLVVMRARNSSTESG